MRALAGKERGAPNKGSYPFHPLAHGDTLDMLEEQQHLLHFLSELLHTGELIGKRAAHTRGTNGHAPQPAAP